QWLSKGLEGPDLKYPQNRPDTEAHDRLRKIGRAVSRTAVAWGRSFFVADAKLMALSRCARRPRCKRPRRRRAAEQRYEVAPFHVEHADFLPNALSAPPTGPCAQSSAPPACRRTARKSLGQT